MLRIYELHQYLNNQGVKILNIISLKITPIHTNVAEENNSEFTLEMKGDFACNGL